MHYREGNVAVWRVGRVGACLKMSKCELGVTNMKVGQDHFSVTDPLDGGAPSFDRD